MLVPNRLAHLGKIVLDGGGLAGIYLLAFGIRFEGAIPSAFAQGMVVTLPFVVAVQLLCLFLLGPRRSSWRHVSLAEALRVVAALTVAGIVIGMWRILGEQFDLWLILGDEQIIPWGVLLIDFPLACIGLIGLRVLCRVQSEHHERRSRRARGVNRVVKSGQANHAGRDPVPTLLLGAGRTGALIAREILSHPDVGIRPVGFLDDNRGLHGLSVGGVAVLGSIAQVAELARRHGANQALITIPNAPPAAIRRITQLCKRGGLPVKIIPSLHEIVGPRINIYNVRNIALEDLLKREPIRLDEDDIHAALRGRRVLVTGAGGSIGSELCRKVCEFGAATILLAEQAENSLFDIHRQIVHAFPDVGVLPCIADICDDARMRQLFASFRPEIVFHAAAHKHVPLMESNASEAIKNNVLGTAGLVRLAHEHGVQQFVMISTDKAVKPSSVMGASKRIAELYVQSFARQSATRFMTVRFGNVLGSNGSVVPLFQEQLARGGPLTVTHPDMKRYFMTIPEACQLVLQTTVMGRGGEIFILDMGEPVKIVDLARDLIGLSGLIPGRDVEIRFTGLRPGEKLSEELFGQNEAVEKTAHPRIFVGTLEPPDWTDLQRQVEKLGELAILGAVEAIQDKLQEIIPDYQPRKANSMAETDPDIEIANEAKIKRVLVEEDAPLAPPDKVTL